MAPPGTKCYGLIKPQKRTSWGYHATNTWYLGPKLDHYWWYEVLVQKNGSNLHIRCGKLWPPYHLPTTSFKWWLNHQGQKASPKCNQPIMTFCTTWWRHCHWQPCQFLFHSPDVSHLPSTNKTQKNHQITNPHDQFPCPCHISFHPIMIMPWATIQCWHLPITFYLLLKHTNFAVDPTSSPHQ